MQPIHDRISLWLYTSTIALWMVLADVGPFASFTVAGESFPVTVHLASGREWCGTINAKSDQSTLWLKIGSSSIELLRPIDWSQVVQIRSSVPESTDPRLASVEDWRRSLPERILNIPTDRKKVSIRVWSPSTAEASSHERVAVVRSLNVAARAENWDSDSQVDGLIVHLTPLGPEGELVAVNGKLEARLLAFRARGPHHYGIGSRVEMYEVGSWTRNIRSAPAASSDQPSRLVANSSDQVVRLPYQTTHFESEQSIVGRYGRLQIRLVVPGQGVFEAIHDGVSLCPFSFNLTRWHPGY